MRRDPLIRLILSLFFAFNIRTALYAQIGPGQTVIVSTGTYSAQGGNSYSNQPSVSADGRFVAFVSHSDNLVPMDLNGVSDVFVKNISTGQVLRVSESLGGGQGDSDSERPSISADGRLISFYSYASNLTGGLTNGHANIYVKDMSSGQLRIVSADASGFPGNSDSWISSISADGRFVAFESLATNLVAGDTDDHADIFVKDLSSGSIRMASTTSSGGFAATNCWHPSISADGRYVAFVSDSANLAPGDSNGTWDVFVKDMSSGAVDIVSTSTDGINGNSYSENPSISADGRWVAFDSFANNLIGGDTNGTFDVFAKDRSTGKLRLASSATDGAKGNDVSEFASISADGRFVAFESLSTNFVGADINDGADVFVKDLTTGQLTIESVSSDGLEGNIASFLASISADGHCIGFCSFATNFTHDDPNGLSSEDVYLHGTGFAGGGSPSKMAIVAGAAYIGKNVTFTALLKQKVNLDPIEGASVQLQLDGTNIGAPVSTDAQGRAIMSYPVAEATSVGTHTVSAVFAGNSVFGASSASKSFSVSAGPVKISVPDKSVVPGNAIFLSAKLLNGSNAPLEGRALNFSVNGIFAGTGTTNSLGLATFKYKVSSGTASGPYPITVTFAGDGSHISGSGSGTLTVG
jgi:Tol biopolymer transport system component